MRSLHTRRITWLHGAMLAAVALIGSATVAFAADGVDVRELRVPTKPISTPIQPSANEPQALSISPGRFDTHTVQPGESLRFTIEVRNPTAKDIAVRANVVALTGSRIASSLVQVADGDAAGADVRTWASLPEGDWNPIIPARTQLIFPVVVQVPEDARPGAYALAVTIGPTVEPGDSDEAGSRVRIAATVGSQIVLTVAGDARSAARIVDIDAPQLVWWDRTPTVAVRVRNTGDTLLTLTARTALQASFGPGTRTFVAPEQLTLPDGERQFRMRWSDPPLLGRFTPKVTVVGEMAGDPGTSTRTTQTLDPMWVLPPWWALIALLAAIVIPFVSVRRRRSQRANDAPDYADEFDEFDEQ